MQAVYTVGVLTSSDAGARGEREDSSGVLIRETLGPPEYEHAEYAVVPDDKATIEQTLRAWADERSLNLILTTGGTGLTDRDVAPEATLAVIDRLAPGLSEAMRAYGLTKTPMAMLSRGIAGVRGRTLIINLPGSPKGVREGWKCLHPSCRTRSGSLPGLTAGTSSADAHRYSYRFPRNVRACVGNGHRWAGHTQRTR